MNKDAISCNINIYVCLGVCLFLIPVFIVYYRICVCGVFFSSTDKVPHGPVVEDVLVGVWVVNCHFKKLCILSLSVYFVVEDVLVGFMVFVCAVAAMILVLVPFTSMQKVMVILWAILLH